MTTEPTSPGRLLDLAPEECWELAATQPVGRLAWTSPQGPIIIPVNFTVDGSSVHIRTAAYSAAARECDDNPVAFEVDTFDEAEHSGWSVLMRGRAHLDFGGPVGPNEPEVWVGGSRRLGLRVEVEEITGRRVQAGA